MRMCFSGDLIKQLNSCRRLRVLELPWMIRLVAVEQINGVRTKGQNSTYQGYQVMVHAFYSIPLWDTKNEAV